MLYKDLKCFFNNYLFYIALLIFTLLFNFKFYNLLLEYIDLYTNYAVYLRDEIYTPYQSYVYILSNLGAYLSYLIIFLISYTNSKIAIELDASCDKFDIYYFKLSFFSYVNFKNILTIIVNAVYIFIPYLLLLLIYPFYKLDFYYLAKILLAHIILIIIFSSISLCFSLFNIKHYFALLFSFIVSLFIYYFLLEKEFIIFYKGGFNFNLLFISFIVYIIFTFINYKIYELRRYS